MPITQLNNFALVDTSTVIRLCRSVCVTASNLNTFTFTAGQAYTLFVFGQPGNATYPLTATWVVDFPGVCLRKEPGLNNKKTRPGQSVNLTILAPESKPKSNILRF